MPDDTPPIPEPGGPNAAKPADPVVDWPQVILHYKGKPYSLNVNHVINAGPAKSEGGWTGSHYTVVGKDDEHYCDESFEDFCRLTRQPVNPNTGRDADAKLERQLEQIRRRGAAMGLYSGTVIPPGSYARHWTDGERGELEVHPASFTAGTGQLRWPPSQQGIIAAIAAITPLFQTASAITDSTCHELQQTAAAVLKDLIGRLASPEVVDVRPLTNHWFQERGFVQSAGAWVKWCIGVVFEDGQWRWVLNTSRLTALEANRLPASALQPLPLPHDVQPQTIGAATRLLKALGQF